MFTLIKLASLQLLQCTHRVFVCREVQTVENVVREDNFELHGVSAFSTTDSENEEQPKQNTSVSFYFIYI
jgi:hypothetical protein